MNNLIYARVSTVEYQDYQRQIDDLKKVILDNGHPQESIQIFSEKISGFKKNEDRPVLNEMLAFIKANPKATVWVTEISRLGRNPAQTRKTIDELGELKVPVYIQSLNRATIDANGNRDGIVNIILQVLMEFAHEEIKQLKTRIKSGKLASAKKGQHATNVFPYGYMKGEDKTIIINPDEVETVRLIYDLYVEGLGMRAIATRLQSSGIPTKFNTIYDADKIVNNQRAGDYAWTIATVEGILKNSIYKGERKYKDEIIPAPAIIEPAQWEKVQEIVKTKTNRNYLTSYTYLLKDLVTCGKCGRNYYAKYKPVVNGDKVYMCSSKITNTPCGQSSINLPLVETLIYNEVALSPSLLKYLSSSKELKKTLANEIKHLKVDIPLTEKAIKELEKKNNKLLDLLLEDKITNTVYNERHGEFKTSLETHKKKLVSSLKDLQLKERALEKFDSEKINQQLMVDARKNRAELQSLFKQFIDKIVVNEIGEKLVLLTIYIKLSETVLLPPMRLVFDKYKVKKYPKYQIFHGISITTDPKFDLSRLRNESKHILTNADELEKAFNQEIEKLGWLSIEKQEFLEVY